MLCVGRRDVGFVSDIWGVFDDVTVERVELDLEDGVLTVRSDKEHQWDGVMGDGRSSLVWIVVNGKIDSKNLTWWKV